MFLSGKDWNDVTDYRIVAYKRGGEMRFSIKCKPVPRYEWGKLIVEKQYEFVNPDGTREDDVYTHPCEVFTKEDFIKWLGYRVANPQVALAMMFLVPLSK